MFDWLYKTKRLSFISLSLALALTLSTLSLLPTTELKARLAGAPVGIHSAAGWHGGADYVNDTGLVPSSGAPRALMVAADDDLPVGNVVPAPRVRATLLASGLSPSGLPTMRDSEMFRVSSWDKDGEGKAALLSAMQRAIEGIVKQGEKRAFDRKCPSGCEWWGTEPNGFCAAERSLGADPCEAAGGRNETEDKGVTNDSDSDSNPPGVGGGGFGGANGGGAADAEIIFTSHKLGTRFDECFKGPPGEGSKGMPVSIEDMGVGLVRAYKRARGAVQKCQGEDEAANTCCRRNPISCVAKSKFAGLLTMALNAAPVAASMALSKRCRKVKTLLGAATSLTTATAQLCQLKVGSCTRQCEQKVAEKIENLTAAIKGFQKSCCDAPPTPVCTSSEGCSARASRTIDCLTQIQSQAYQKAQNCTALEGHVVPKMQEAMMVQMLGSGLAARCEAVTSDQPDAKDIKPPAAGGCDENPHLPLCKGPRDLSFKPGQLTPSSLDDDGLDNYDINDGPAIPDGALDYQGNPDSQPGNLGPVQGGGGGGGGGGSLGGGSGGGGGGGGSGARRPASSAGASTQGSILKGFNKGGGFSGAGGGSGGYSQRAGGGYGANNQGSKRRFNLGKYFGKKTKGSALNKVNRHIASATGSIWVNIAQRYKAVCHKQKLYCD